MIGGDGSIDLREMQEWSDADFRRLRDQNPDIWATLLVRLAEGTLEDRQACALAHYRMMNPQVEAAHRSVARELCLVGGNRSGKSETALAELAIGLTGHVPEALKPFYPMEKIKPPIRGLVMCTSLIDTLPMLHGKLRWDTWSGYGAPDEGRGHWGWIPKRCLAGGSWEKAYSEKYRTLTVAVDSFWVGSDGAKWNVRTHSKCQFGSYDQDPMTVAGKSYHLVVNDEFPPADLYREEKMRTLDVKGRIITAFTPPDEAGTNRGDISWFYDQVYERGLPGPQKDPLIDTVILWTEKNRILAPEDVRQIIRGYTDDQLQARLFGSFLHLSGVVYPLFSSVPVAWCFACRKKIAPLAACPHCGGDDLEPFCHVVAPWDVPKTWPIVFVIDPHPRKPDACGWFAVSPSDDVVMIGELEAEGSADEVARSVFDWETAHKVHPVRRLMDPNIATETNDRLEHGWTLRMAYDRAGLRCDLANDSIPLGIQNVNGLLVCDPLTRRPRFTTFSTNRKFIFGMCHWAYDEWQRHAGDKEPKETVRDRHKDMPDLLRYMANSVPDYRSLVRGGIGAIRMAVPTRGY